MIKKYVLVLSPFLMSGMLACGETQVQPSPAARAAVVAPVCPPCATSKPAPAVLPAASCPGVSVVSLENTTPVSGRWDNAVSASYLKTTAPGEFQEQYAVFDITLSNPESDTMIGFMLPARLPAPIISLGKGIPVRSMSFSEYSDAQNSKVTLLQIDGSPDSFRVVWVPPKKRFQLKNVMIPNGDPNSKKISMQIPVTSIDAFAVFSSAPMDWRRRMAPLWDMLRLPNTGYSIDVGIKDSNNIPVGGRQAVPAGESWTLQFNALHTVEINFNIAS